MTILTPRVLFLIAVGAIVIGLAPQIARAQTCPGSSLTYIVRDAKGVAIDAGRADLRYQPFLRWGVTKGNIVSNRIAAPGAVVALNGRVNALGTGQSCSFKQQPTLNLTLDGKSMNLIFHTSPLPGYHSTSYLVDSLPFQQGTFEIEIPNKPDYSPQFFPATGWKKISDKAEAVPAPSYMFVRGHVVDAITKKPIVGARVSLLSWLAVRLDKQGIATTDRNGAFEIKGLRSDYMADGWDVAVVAEHQDYANGYVKFYPLEGEQAGKAREPFKSIENATIELTPLATVSGRVIDAATGGVPADLDRLDVTFTYRKQGYLPGGNIEYPRGEAKTKINPDGTFSLRAAVGNNTVTSVEPLYMGSCGKCYYLASDDDGYVKIDVPKEGRTGLILKLRSKPR
jgi:hypothetical protein